MSAPATIADVWARGAEPEARGDQKECLPARLVPLVPTHPSPIVWGREREGGRRTVMNNVG